MPTAFSVATWVAVILPGAITSSSGARLAHAFFEVDQILAAGSDRRARVLDPFHIGPAGASPQTGMRPP